MLEGKPEFDLDLDVQRGSRSAGVSAKEFCAVMRRRACTVAIVTTHAQHPIGCTITSLASVSLDPPLVAFSLGLDSDCGQAWKAAKYGVVHLLHEEQAELSRRFADSGGKDRFSNQLQWHYNRREVPVLVGTLAHLEIEACSRFVVGDHLLVIAVVTATHSSPGRPLLYYNRCYVRVNPDDTLRNNVRPSIDDAVLPLHTAVGVTSAGEMAEKL